MKIIVYVLFIYAALWNLIGAAVGLIPFGVSFLIANVLARIVAFFYEVLKYVRYYFRRI